MHARTDAHELRLAQLKDDDGGRSQTRGGRKGGAVAREWRNSITAAGTTVGGSGRCKAPELRAPQKLKHLAAQPAEAWHSAIRFPSGEPSLSQQSCDAETETESSGTILLLAKAMPPMAGRSANHSEIAMDRNGRSLIMARRAWNMNRRIMGVN